MRVLVVDPSRHLRNLITTEVTQQGYIADCCESNEAALVALGSRQYGLITTARHLQDGDYTHLVRSIRQHPGYQFTPILLITSSDEQILFSEALANGVTDIYCKQQPAELFAGLRRSLYHCDLRCSGRALVLEDTRATAMVLKSMLNSYGMRVDCYDNFESASAALKETEYDLAIIDLILKDSHTGLELIHKIRHSSVEAIRNLPTIALTGYNDSARRIMAFHLGVDDYITKPVMEEELKVRLERVLTRHKLIDQLRERESYLSEMALKDSLTGLYNRHGLSAYLKKRLRSCQKQAIPAVLLALDLDHFKQLNDSMGHPVGDRLLKQLGDTLNQLIRSDDIAGRTGGDEFILFLHHCDDSAIDHIAARIKEGIHHEFPGVGCSIGFSHLQPDDSLESLMVRADKALYRAKHNNKGGVEQL